MLLAHSVVQTHYFINNSETASLIPHKEMAMKISDTTQLPVRDGCSSVKSNSQNASGFQQVFQNMFDREKMEYKGPSVISHSPCPPPLSVGAVETIHANAGLQGMERLLDSLDTYQKKLADPQYTLRDLEPDLNRLEKEHRHLSRWAEKTVADSPLKNIINEGLVTATLEISRFRSGTYC